MERNKLFVIKQEFCQMGEVEYDVYLCTEQTIDRNFQKLKDIFRKHEAFKDVEDKLIINDDDSMFSIYPEMTSDYYVTLEIVEKEIL
jgi:hypothetical protein